jgi:hypothetical protein
VVFLKVVVLLLLFVSPVFTQEQSSNSENPLAQLKDQVAQVLKAAAVPFSQDQENAIVLMMEDRRRASEDLFGNLMDFRAGPTRGEDADRLRSAIEWMRSEFIGGLNGYLTDVQVKVWTDFVARGGLDPAKSETVAATGRTETEQTQYVRIHNNAYTSEDASYRFGQSGGGARPPEVIQRGGAGSFHGNAQFLIKDDSLNARNPFAQNKPQYQERQTRVDVSGPLVPGLLTTAFGFGQDEAENVDTIHATLSTGLFELGIVRPTTNRFYNTRNTLQLSDNHALDLNLNYSTNRSLNQGVGGFTLPQRAFAASGNDLTFEVRQFSTPSPRNIYETRFSIVISRDETRPITDGIQIDVLDAFQGGGAQNLTDTSGRNYTVSNMYTRLGEAWTLKAGFEGVYRKNRSFSETNFGGAFTFSSLEAFIAQTPVNFRRTSGDPLLDSSQFETALFLQNDLKLTSQLSLMLGLRYQTQTNISDHNNVDPRFGFAYAIGRNTVIRGGAALFHQQIPLSNFETQRRFDGTRQFEIIIDNPSFPDPFVSGTVRENFPSINVTDRGLAAPYNAASGVQFERTFYTNLFIGASYHINKYIHRHRLRDLNAPLPACTAGLASRPSAAEIRACRPDPGRGNVLNLESTAGELEQYLRLNYRQRFSIFNVSANYSLGHITSDSRPNNPAIPTDNYDLRADWGLIARPMHSLQTTINARLPLGLFLTGSLAADSGRRYTITTGRDDNRDTRVNDRPPGVPRGSEDGPNFLSADFNISKAIFFGAANGRSRANLNVFANMTNAFNRTNLGVPSGVMTSPNFRKATSAVNPREIEAGLRFQF